jgi:hypothetical protein
MYDETLNIRMFYYSKTPFCLAISWTTSAILEKLEASSWGQVHVPGYIL